MREIDAEAALRTGEPQVLPARPADPAGWLARLRRPRPQERRPALDRLRGEDQVEPASATRPGRGRGASAPGSAPGSPPRDGRAARRTAADRSWRRSRGGRAVAEHELELVKADARAPSGRSPRAGPSRALLARRFHRRLEVLALPSAGSTRRPARRAGGERTASARCGGRSRSRRFGVSQTTIAPSGLTTSRARRSTARRSCDRQVLEHRVEQEHVDLAPPRRHRVEDRVQRMTARARRCQPRARISLASQLDPVRIDVDADDPPGALGDRAAHRGVAAAVLEHGLPRQRHRLLDPRHEHGRPRRRRRCSQLLGSSPGSSAAGMPSSPPCPQPSASARPPDRPAGDLPAASAPREPLLQLGHPRLGRAARDPRRA